MSTVSSGKHAPGRVRLGLTLRHKLRLPVRKKTLVVIFVEIHLFVTFFPVESRGCWELASLTTLSASSYNNVDMRAVSAEFSVYIFIIVSRREIIHV